MTDASPDPIALLKGLAQSATRIRLAPGVLGKTYSVMLGIIVVWMIVLLRLSATAWGLNAALILIAILVTVIMIWLCRQAEKFAIANPALALMEGADITEYQRFEAEAKGHRSQMSTLIVDPAQRERPPTAPMGPDENG